MREFAQGAAERAHRVHPEVATATRGARETAGGWQAESHHLTDVSGHLFRKDPVAPPGTCPEVALTTRGREARAEARRCAGDRPMTTNHPRGYAPARAEARRCAGDRTRHPFACNWPHTQSRNSLKTRQKAAGGARLDARFGPRFPLRLSPILFHIPPVFLDRNTPEVERGQPHENKESARLYIATKTHLFEEKAKPCVVGAGSNPGFERVRDLAQSLPGPETPNLQPATNHLTPAPPALPQWNFRPTGASLSGLSRRAKPFERGGRK